MNIKIDIELELPAWWEFSGLWYDQYEKEEEERWSANADWYQGERPNRRAVMSAESKGSTAQEALERLPKVVHDNIAKAIGMVVGVVDPDE